MVDRDDPRNAVELTLTAAGPAAGLPHFVLGPNNTCTGDGPAGGNGAAPPGVTRSLVPYIPECVNSTASRINREAKLLSL